ncbi:M48 family metallopeptidase [Desulfovibrio sp. Huiquan2017]|uniref:M48 family metallopeptidase n=1 Tax=Desulfovibrio sp. Huiquan2017 TaxID=2816861 RepID=UPI001A911D3D|nr:M48 family metallopeptidase [Desulfovibrio sp. Huiquan2017]
MFRSLPLIVLTLVLCSACQTPGVKDVQSWVGAGEPEGRFIDQFKEPASGDAALSPDTQAATPGEEVSAGKEEPKSPTISIPEKALTGQRLSIGVARNKNIEAYLNSVLKKLQQAWPRESVSSYVFLRPSPEFNAYSTDQAIFVDYGLLRALESEDEVAALLAHEYSHILLGHQSLQSWSSMIGFAVEAYQTSTAVQYQTSGNTDNLIKNAVLGTAADKLGQEAFIPVFSRENEEEADALGTDLLLAAHYSPMGMVHMLQRLTSWEALLEQRKEEARKAAEEEKAKDGKREFSMDKLFADLGKATDKIGRRHYAATERLQTVKSYVRANYAQTPRNALLTAPYQVVFASSVTKRYFSGLDDMENAKKKLLAGQQKDALKLIRSHRCTALTEAVPYIRSLACRIATANGKPMLKALQADCQRDDTLLAEYKDLMARYEPKAPDKALTVADTAYESLDKTEVLLPDLIRLNRKVGDEGKTLAYFLTCKTSGNSELVALCQENLDTKKEK